MQKKTSVSPKSTKQEIWNAYQELLSEISQEPSTPAVIKKLETANATVKQQLSSIITELTQVLQSKLVEVTGQFDQAAKVLDQLNQLHAAQTQELAREKEDTLTALQREEDDARYEFEKLKKHQAEELAEQKQKFEAELETRKVELKNQEDELKDLRQKVAGFTDELEKAAKEAVERITQDLTREFNHQKILSQQQAQAHQELLQQKISSLEATIKTQQAEIFHLQSTLKENNQLLTRIAERAVEKGPSATSATGKE